MADFYKHAKPHREVMLTCSRYVEKFYAMRSQLQKISLRLQVSLMQYCYSNAQARALPR